MAQNFTSDSAPAASMLLGALATALSCPAFTVDFTLSPSLPRTGF